MNLLREARLQNSPATCVAISPNFTQLALDNVAGGGVYLFRGDFVKEKTCKLRLVKVEQQVTGLHLLAIRVMFICTHSYVASYSTANDVQLLFLDSGGGAQRNCSAVVESSSLLLVMRDGAIFTFHHTQGNLSAIPCEGTGVMLRTFKNYVIAVTQESQDKEAVVTVCFTLPEARFVAFGGRFNSLMHVVPSKNSIFLVTSEGGRVCLCQLEEKDITERLTVLMRKRLFEWAREIATAEQQSEEVIQEIYRAHADWLYDKHNYEQAVEVYCKTVGFVEPSYVIQRYLDAQRLQDLASYLLWLHERNVAEAEHTVLLLKCYTKLKEVEKMEEFVKSAANKHYDLSVAIAELRVAGYSKLAADIAMRQQHDELYVAILVEDYKEYWKAIAHLQSLQTPVACAILLKYGRPLLRFVPEATVELIMRIMKTDRPSVEVFIPIFAGNPRELQTFLAEALTWQAELGDTGSPTAFTTYLELLLRAYDKSRNTTSATGLHRAIMKLLKDHAASDQDLEAATCLCRLYHHEEGLVYASEKTLNYQLPFSLYLEKADIDGMLSYCARCGSKDPTLWTQALTSLSTCDGAEQHIIEVLKQVKRLKILKPLAVLSILKQNSSITLGAVKEYVLSSLREQSVCLRESEDRIQRDQQEISRMKQETWLLRTTARVFQASRCFQCGLPLELPSIHFYCMHSYHSRCVLPDRHCPKCAPVAASKKTLMEQRQFQARNADDFFKFLRGAPDGFSYIAEYYGKGMFPFRKKMGAEAGLEPDLLSQPSFSSPNTTMLLPLQGTPESPALSSFPQETRHTEPCSNNPFASSPAASAEMTPSQSRNPFNARDTACEASNGVYGDRISCPQTAAIPSNAPRSDEVSSNPFPNDEKIHQPESTRFPIPRKTPPGADSSSNPFEP